MHIPSIQKEKNKSLHVGIYKYTLIPSKDTYPYILYSNTFTYTLIEVPFCAVVLAATTIIPHTLVFKHVSEYCSFVFQISVVVGDLV